MGGTAQDNYWMAILITRVWKWWISKTEKWASLNCAFVQCKEIYTFGKVKAKTYSRVIQKVWRKAHALNIFESRICGLGLEFAHSKETRASYTFPQPPSSCLSLMGNDTTDWGTDEGGPDTSENKESFCDSSTSPLCGSCKLQSNDEKQVLCFTWFWNVAQKSDQQWMSPLGFQNYKLFFFPAIRLYTFWYRTAFFFLFFFAAIPVQMTVTTVFVCTWNMATWLWKTYMYISIYAYIY